ncbi:MAG: CRTAC1 family protein [Phycisphaerales bacterium]
MASWGRVMAVDRFVPVVVLAIACAAPSQAQLLQFTDCTLASGLTHSNLIGNMTFLGFDSAGGAVGDFNRDGWTDVFVLGGGGAPDALFINQGLDASGQAVFVDEAASWGLGATQHAFGASVADYDKDGDLDIFVTASGPGDAPPVGSQMKLYRNNFAQREASFTDVAQDAGVNVLRTESFYRMSGSGWGDYDLDGDLDLFVCAYWYQASNNRLFRNDGPGQDGAYTFTDVTTAMGLEFTGVNGFFPVWIDMNGDAYPELVVIGDTGTSRYFVNNAGTSFTQTSGLVEAFNNAMGASFGDVNNDGLIDLYVSGAYYPFLEGPGNQLMVQQADGSFVDVAPEAGVMNGGWAWGTLMCDLDLDGLEDVACTNGFNQLWVSDATTIWKNIGAESFFNTTDACGVAETGQGRGLITFDMDNDGDEDVLILRAGQPLIMYRNDTLTPGEPTPTGLSWLRVNLDTSARPSLAPDGHGALVTAVTDAGEWIEPVYGRTDHCTTGEAGAHFGLGDSTTVEALRVRWNDGTYTTLVDVAPNQIVTVRAPFSVADLDGSGDLNYLDVLVLLQAFGAGSPVADLTGDWALDFSDVLAFMIAFGSG